MGAIRINQMGYSANSTKQVVYVGKGVSFQLYRAKDNQMVLQSEMKVMNQRDEASGDLLCVGDFSRIRENGDYYIVINNEKSLTFTISDRQHMLCTDALLKAFYYQRCGVKLEEQYAGKWKHSACHLQTSYLFPNSDDNSLSHEAKQNIIPETSGGWHDAGDYGRYTIATAKTAADLLLAYEHFTKAFDHPIGIPESCLEGADILYEVKVGLDFLFKMQRQDGAAYTKVTSLKFPGVIMPENDSDPLYVFDISSPATADFVAVMAMASKIYREFDECYAEKCLNAAKKAYEWLKDNPEPKPFTNPPDILSGEYGDSSDVDERFWAAAQMYRTTGEEQYHNDFILYFFMVKERHSLGWRNVSGYGSIAYLFCDYEVNQEVYDQLKREWLSYASELEQRSEKDGYGITLSPGEYYWGSLMGLLNQSMHLIIANRLEKNNIYDPIIERSWDYLFGMNPMDLSYVTGMGARSMKDPHHRPSAADNVEEPVPGLVAGGPCSALKDETVKELCQGLPPAKCYVDNYQSYSTNEVDIYWNSPAVYVGAYLCSCR